MLRTCLFVLFFCLSADIILAQDYRDTITQQLEFIAQQDQVPGFGVALIHKDEILYQHGFGYADRSQQIPYTVETIHNIGSMSKTLISFVLMKMVEEGKLRLDDPINLYLPQPIYHHKKKKKDITVRMLATHTSGLTDGPDDMTIEYSYLLEKPAQFKPGQLSEDYIPYIEIYNQNQSMDMATFLYHCHHPEGKWYSGDNFGSAPGKKYQYTNIGATWLAYVLECIAEQPFHELTKTYILDPLGMKHSGWFLKDIDSTAFAELYLENNLAFPRYDLITYPDGALKTSIKDFAPYIQEMIKGYTGESSLMQQAGYQEMMSNQLTKTNFPKGKFKKAKGYNWNMNADGDNISMNGGDPGIMSYTMITTAGDLGILIFMNCSLFENEEKLASFFQIRNTLMQNAGPMLKQAKN
ncbi:MAG: serine hydrolase domain-containing protein [Bacteroidota bacterium]